MRKVLNGVKLTHSMRSMLVAAWPALAVVLWLVLACDRQGQLPSLNDAEVTPEERRDALINALVEGQVFYRRTSIYAADRGGRSSSTHTYPQHTVEESWMLMGANREVVASVSKLYNKQGDLISTTTRNGTTTTYKDLISGDTLVFPDSLAEDGDGDIAGWLRAMWARPQELETDGYRFVGESSLLNKTSSIYERTTSTGPNEHGPEEIRHTEMEFVRTAPLLHRLATYDVEDGQKTLTYETTILEYRVRPESRFPRDPSGDEGPIQRK